MAIILASTNQAISLGGLLSKGGEGSVFVLPSMQGFVAKTYHAPLEASQQRKLKYMVGLGEEEIFSHTAWPTDCLLSADRSKVVGIVMHHIHGMTAVHTAYNAKSRQKRFPNSTWEFLLCVARNTAAAFETVHSRGHIVGDINETNILVGPDASVRLLDCDSFQIAANGEIHSCRVGVSAFTPPELQGKSFAGIRRTSNHDGFGLAVIIFHLLFNGRHPFAGRPLRPDVGGEPAENIAAFRFAYADDNVSRGLGVPPKASPLTLVPAAMRPMFHRAFTEDALKYGRPTAAEWLEALDDCLDSVAECRRHSGHVFPGHHDQCPWCELDSKGLKLFPHQRGVSHPQRARRPFEFKKWQASLNSVSVPPPVAFPNINAVPGSPAIESPPIRDCIARTAIRIASTIAFLVAVVFASVPTKVVVAGATVSVWFAAAYWEQRRYASARRDQEARLAAAQAKWVGVQVADAGQANLVRLRSDLLGMKSQHASIEGRLAGLKKAAMDREAARLMREHLIQFHVGTADIPGLTKANRETLQSYFMWNAHDVSPEKLSAVPGFGRVKVATMLEWRRQCEASFCLADADVDTVLTDDDQWKALREELGKLQGQMQTDLRRLQAQLPKVRENREHLQRLVDQAARELEEAQREATATVYVGDWQAVAKIGSEWTARSGATASRWLKRLRLHRPLGAASIAVVMAGCLIAAVVYSTLNRQGPATGKTPTPPGKQQGTRDDVMPSDPDGSQAGKQNTRSNAEPTATKKAEEVVVYGPVDKPRDAQAVARDPIAVELESALPRVKRAAATGNSEEATTLIKKAFKGKGDVSGQYFREWRDLILAGRDAFLQEARNLDTAERLTVEVVDAKRNATNVLRLLMRELIKQGEREQATKVFTQAKREYEKLLERVAVDWKTGAVTKRMDQEQATLLEYDAMLYRDFYDLSGDQQGLESTMSKYEKCVRFRRAFLESDPATDRLQKVLDELKATARKTNQR